MPERSKSDTINARKTRRQKRLSEPDMHTLITTVKTSMKNRVHVTVNALVLRKWLDF